MRCRLLPLLAVASLAAACTQSDLAYETELRDPPAPEGDVVQDPDAVVDLALGDVERFWSETFPDRYDAEFEPLRGGYVPYGPDTAPPTCGPEPLTYEIVAENALYCPAEDLIAWDRVNLIPDLQERFGALTVGMVMAHEFAHAVQVRAGVRGATVTLELQADCFAGAWVDDTDDRIATFATGGDSLDQAVAGLLELRDTLGVPGEATNAHGSGFDRVGAFQDGFEGGAEACVRYAEEPPAVVAIPFGSAVDAASGGNLPTADLIEPLVADLQSFFGSLFESLGEDWDPVSGLEVFDPDDGAITCGDEVLEPDQLELSAFYCVDDDTAYVDGAGLVPELESIGDFAFGGELARLYAHAAQEQLDAEPSDDAAAALHADCLTGVFAAAEFRQEIPEQRLVLSPGDLDEIIIAFLAFGAEDDLSAFERTAAFRSGFVDGVAPCEDLLG